MTFAEEFIMFLISAPKGFESLQTRWINLVINFHASTGLFVGLCLDKKIVVDNNGFAKLTDNKISEDETEQLILNEISKSTEVKTYSYWINYFSDVDYPDKSKTEFQIYKKILLSLEKKNLIAKEYKKILFFFDATSINSTENGADFLVQKSEKIKTAIQTEIFEMPLIVLILLINLAIDDVLKEAYFGKEATKKLSALIENPTFQQTYAEAFRFVDMAKKAFNSKAD